MTGDDDEHAFNEAFDRQEMRRLTGELAPIFREHGVGRVAPHPGMVAQRQRELDLVASDQRYVAREQARQLAQLEVSEGNYVNIGDMVVEPTEEWLRHGDVRKFTPRQPKGTVRTIATVRRVLTPVVVKLAMLGRLDRDEAAACLWYRTMYDKGGMEGRVKISRYGPLMPGGSASDPSFGHLPRNLSEAQARTAFREAREIIPANYLIFFDKIVLYDIPIRRAARFARCPERKAEPRFRMLAERLASHCSAMGIELARDEN